MVHEITHMKHSNHSAEFYEVINCIRASFLVPYFVHVALTQATPF